MKINTYSYVENPKVSPDKKIALGLPIPKGGQSVAEALSQRHFIMAAALIEPKIGSAGTDSQHKVLLPSDRECISDTEKYIYGRCITNIGHDMAMPVLLGDY